MEHYEEKLKRRLIFCRVLIVTLLALMILIGVLSDRGVLLDSRTMSRTAQMVPRLIIFGGIVLLLILHRRTAFLLSDRIARDRQRIAEEDERRQYIQQRSNSLTLEALFAIGTLAVLILSYVDMTAFTTAYLALLCGLLLKGITWLYCKSKVG